MRQSRASLGRMSGFAVDCTLALGVCCGALTQALDMRSTLRLIPETGVTETSRVSRSHLGNTPCWRFLPCPKGWVWAVRRQPLISFTAVTPARPASLPAQSAILGIFLISSFPKARAKDFGRFSAFLRLSRAGGGFLPACKRRATNGLFGICFQPNFLAMLPVARRIRADEARERPCICRTKD